MLLCLKPQKIMKWSKGDCILLDLLWHTSYFPEGAQTHLKQMNESRHLLASEEMIKLQESSPNIFIIHFFYVANSRLVAIIPDRVAALFIGLLIYILSHSVTIMKITLWTSRASSFSMHAEEPIVATDKHEDFFSTSNVWFVFYSWAAMEQWL